jgi:hypothetical protein
LNKTEPNPGKHDCRAKIAIQTRAAGVMQRNSREAAIVQASFSASVGAPLGAWSSGRQEQRCK